MSKRRRQKRILICTFAALASGLFSSYVGGQISLKVQSQKCQTQPWGLKTVCNAWVAPGAIWQGSTTGLWVGTLLGALISGLATRKLAKEKAIASIPADITEEKLIEAISLCADDLELTPTQKETLRRFLVLLVIKLGTSSETNLESEQDISLEELQHLAAVAKQQPLRKQNLIAKICQAPKGRSKK